MMVAVITCETSVSIRQHRETPRRQPFSQCWLLIAEFKQILIRPNFSHNPTLFKFPLLLHSINLLVNRHLFLVLGSHCVIFSHYSALKNIFLSVAFAFMLAHINFKTVTLGLFTCTRESFRYHLMNLLIAKPSFKFSSRLTYSRTVFYSYFIPRRSFNN
jgi:hypothetical protein